MNKIFIFLLLSTGAVLLSVALLAVGPMVNQIHGQEWGYLNCKLISDQAKLLKDDVTKLKRMKNLCYRQKAMHNMEYTSFIINIILGFICADLALIHYIGFGKDFEIKTGAIGFIAGIIGFILALVYVCYSGYIFTKDVAYQEVSYSGNDLKFDYTEKVTKLYSNGATLKWESDEDPDDEDKGKYITPFEYDRKDDSNLVRYKDLGKKQYNYNSKFYKSYHNHNDKEEEENLCRNYNQLDKKYEPSDITCEYIYGKSPEEGVEHKELFGRWLAALILGCLVLLCDLGIALFGLLLFTNFGTNLLV